MPSGIVTWTRYLVNHYIKGMNVSRPSVFIVGCGHSGTTLLRQILGAHSLIYDIPYESRLGLKNNPKRLIAYFDRLAICEKKTRWVEKTPRHIHCIPQLLELLPDAKILIILRDGRDVACSIKDRHGDIEEAITRWVEDNLAGEAYWQHPNVYVLKYESIIEDFEGTIATVLDFIGEEYEPAMHEYHRMNSPNQAERISKPPSPNGKNHNRYRRWQISQPLFDGRGKWKGMTDEEKRIVQEHAGEMLARYGYADGDWDSTPVVRHDSSEVGKAV